MLDQLLSTIGHEVSGDAAKGLVARICQWHRIQASPMYREAAGWLYDTLRGWGLPAELESYPSRDGLWAWAEPLFQEWSCAEGWLDLLPPEGGRQRLADYRAAPLSLMPRSAPANGEFELVILEGGAREEDYAGLDLRGKIVLTRSMPMAAHQLAVERFGAAGLIFDGMRTIPEIGPPGDLPDALQYASWWWWGGEARAFGFVLSPRAGLELRRRQARALAAGRPLRLRAHVRSSFADGAIESVSALIPGQSDEQVLLVAHLCHPAPCANDNASGAAAAMEVARALHELIATGRLARPRRGIRFLWVPEMTGTFLYLAHHEEQIARTVAGLNLDMVGADQAQTGSVSLIVRGSDALPSFAADLLEALRDRQIGPAHSFRHRGEPPLFRHASTPVSNGSDHYILGDPSVGIPTPMIIEWPDRFYHTSADSLEKVSPATLRRNMTLAGAYCYAAASAGPNEAAWLAGEMNARFVARAAAELSSAAASAMAGRRPHGAPWPERLAFRLERHALALADLGRLAPGFDAEPHQGLARAALEPLWQQFRPILERWQPAERPGLPAEQARLVPRRLYRGPLSLAPHLRRLPEPERAAAEAERRDHGFGGLAADLALYWADGRRSLAAILDLVELECEQRDPAGLYAHFRLLERLGLVALEDPAPPAH